MEGKAKVSLTFGVYQGGELVRRETVTQDIVKVGKDARSHLRVDDELASRMHAVIEVASPTDLTLIDLGNEVGTMVNGQRVNKCKIRPGDQVQIGSTVVQLEKAEPAPASTTAIGSENVPQRMTPTEAIASPVGTPSTLHVPPSVPAPGSYRPQPGSSRSNSPPGMGAGGFAAPATANPFVAGGPSDNPFAANPFASPFATSPEPMLTSPGGSDFDPSQPYTYSMVKSGPDVNPDEVEIAHLAAIEVMVLWDSNVLHVQHLTPPRSYYVGEAPNCDYSVAEAALGTTRAPIVLARGGSAALVILPRSTGTVEMPNGQGTFTLHDLVSQGRARASGEVSGAHEFELPAGAKARMTLENGLTFQVSAVNAGKSPPVGAFASFETAAAMFVGLSFLLHMGVIATVAFFMPKMNVDDSEDIDRDQLLFMQKMLDASAEREQEEKTEQTAENNADSKEGGSGTRAKGEEGSMGKPDTKDTNKRYAVQGAKDNPDPHLARQAALREAAEFGMIGLVNVGAGGDPNAPTAPWGKDDSSGVDPMSARGNMWGDTIGDAFGAGGLGLSGTGEGGGGRGEGIGLGNVGGLGHGAGTGSGQGFGNGHGRLSGTHTTKAPRLVEVGTSVNGRLPPEVIQRIVRQNFGRFRLCFENGLRNNPNLSGRVSVKFIIDRSGAVSTSSDGGSDLPDSAVVGCVVRNFGSLSFPQPEGGIVTVVYPIMFSPGG